MKAPFPWFGGKSRAAELIWSRLGEVPNYVEPFAGSLAVLLSRPDEPRLETVDDKDCYLANFWRAIQVDPKAVARWADWPVNEADLHARHIWLVEKTGFRERMRTDPDFFSAKIAGWWVWGISLWIGSGWCSRPEWVGRGHGGKKPRIDRNGASGSVNAINLNQKRPHISTRSTGGVHFKRPHSGRKGLFAQLPHLYWRRGIECRSAGIIDWMEQLSGRLRTVRVCCGDWQRVVTPSVTWKVGGSMLCGVLLDPPYDLRVARSKESGGDGGAPNHGFYADHDNDLSAAVREWAIENGSNRLLRIALCGLEGEHEMPENWDCVPWKANGGYANQSAGGARNAARERIWFSPHCLKAFQASLFREEVSA